MGRRKFYGNKLLLLSMIGMFYCLIMSSYNLEYYYWVLPTIYTIMLLFSPNHRYLSSRNIGSFILNLTMSMRYVLLPVIYYSTEQLSRFLKSYNEISFSLVIMVFELIVVMTVLEYTAKKYRKLEQNYENTMLCNEIYALELRNGKFLALFIGIILAFFAIKYKDLGAGSSVIATGKLVSSLGRESNHIINILWETLCVWLYVYLLHKEAAKFNRTRTVLSLVKVSVYTLFFILISFIQDVAFSRWYTIVTATSSVACLFRLFPRNKKFFTGMIVIPFIALIVLITAYKNAGFEVGHSSFGDSVKGIFTSSNFDAYFSGPGSVNNAVIVKQHYNYLGTGTIFRDMFNNMPIINKHVDYTQTSVYAYNASIGRIWDGKGDQIIPLVGQSFIYFGYTFSPLLSVLSVLIMRKCDFLYKTSSSFLIYLYAFLSVWYSVLPMMLNLTINVSWIYIRVIPFFLVLYATNVVSSRKRGLTS